MSRKAYVVANLEVIHDKDKFRDYERGLVKSLSRHEGQLLTFSDNVECLEAVSYTHLTLPTIYSV